MGTTRERPRPLAQAHPRRDRREPAPARHRLPRPVPGARLRPDHAARRDTAGARRLRARRQGALPRLLELLGVAAHEGDGAGARARHRALRLPAAAVLAGVPLHRARAPPALPRGRHWRDPLEPARRRPADGQDPQGRRGARGLARRGRPDEPRAVLEREATWRSPTRWSASAKSLGKTASQVALGWAATQPGVTSPIFGARTLEQLEDNLGAADLVIPEEERKRLDEVSRARARLPVRLPSAGARHDGRASVGLRLAARGLRQLLEERLASGRRGTRSRADSAASRAASRWPGVALHGREREQHAPVRRATLHELLQRLDRLGRAADRVQRDRHV